MRSAYKLLQKVSPPHSSSNAAFVLSRSYSSETMPYTNQLYKKNFIKYTMQSKKAIAHDYVYTGDERLPTLKERFEEYKDPIDALKTKNIGRPQTTTLTNDILKKIQTEVKTAAKNRTLELLSRDNDIHLPIEQVNKDWSKYSDFAHIKEAADHYKIFRELFDRAYFYPTLDLKVEYETTDDKKKTRDVFYGNKIQAQLTTKAPKVSWTADKSGRLKTLLFLNLDGNFQNSKNEALLWFVSNIKGNEISTGTEICEYLQPFPMKGSGWHRCAFVMFDHAEPIDFEDVKKRIEAEKGHHLRGRDFKTPDFYVKYQEALTPVGLSFFQTEYDLSVKNVFHKDLNMKEPIYEYQFDSKFLPVFEKYPIYQPFNWYLSEYRDIKDVNEEVMKDYMKDLSPFAQCPEPDKYPLIDLKHMKPRWAKFEVRNQRSRKVQYSMVPFAYPLKAGNKLAELEKLPYQQK